MFTFRQKYSINEVNNWGPMQIGSWIHILSREKTYSTGIFPHSMWCRLTKKCIWMNGTGEQSDYYAHYDMRKGVNFYWNWHKVVYILCNYWIWKVIYKNWYELELRVLLIYVHFADSFYFV